MTEDNKPKLSIGLFTAPVVIPNFSTDVEGHNIVVEQLINLFAMILDETWNKMQDMTHQLLDEMGVEVQMLPPEIVREVIIQALEKGQETGLIHGVLTQKGKVILDEQAIEHFRKGFSVDN